MQYLDQWGQSQGYIVYLSQKTGLRHAYIVILLFALTLLLSFHAILNGFVLFIVGVIGPAYRTFKVIESPHQDDDTKMLCYWCVLGFLMILDRFLGFMLDFLYLPGVIRFAILLTLIYKDYSISQTLYKLTLGPILKRYDVHIEKATAVMGKATEEATKARGYVVGKAVGAAIRQAAQEGTQS